MLEDYRRRPDLLAQLERLAQVRKGRLSGSQGVLLGLAAAIKDDAKGLKLSGLKAASPFALLVVATTTSSVGLYQAERDPDHLDVLTRTLEGLSPDPRTHDFAGRARLVPDHAAEAVCQEVGRFEGTDVWPITATSSILAKLREAEKDPVRLVMVRLLVDLYVDTDHLTLHDLLTTDPVVTIYVGQLLGALSKFYAGDEDAITEWLVEASYATSLVQVREESKGRT